ncbi:MAG: hypothetical protein ACYC6H_10530, partial [Bellilinea sp.]
EPNYNKVFKAIISLVLSELGHPEGVDRKEREEIFPGFRTSGRPDFLLNEHADRLDFAAAHILAGQKLFAVGQPTLHH